VKDGELFVVGGGGQNGTFALHLSHYLDQ
jgi:hypothetical protein